MILYYDFLIFFSVIYIEAHPIDPGVLYCCYTANNNDWSHVQRPKYQRFVKSSIAVDRKKQSTNRRKFQKYSIHVYTHT